MTFLVIIPILVGWVAGWLVNYLSDVLPYNRRLSFPICSKCRALRRWSDFLFFKRCAQCKKRGILRTWLVHTGMMIAILLVWFFPGRVNSFSLSVLLLIFLAVVFVIDVEHRLILHVVSIAGAILSLGIGIYIHSGKSIYGGVVATLLGGVLGFLVMLVFYYLGELFVKFMSRRRGLPAEEVALGFGDVNLAGVIGLLVGFKDILPCLFFAILAGGLGSLVVLIVRMIQRKYTAFMAIPYAPFLIIAALFFLFIY